MSWQQVQASDVLTEFNSAEQSAIETAQADTNQPANLAAILARVVAEFQDAIFNAGTPLGDAGTLPLGLHGQAIALARWRYVIALPGLESLQTKAREAAAKTAEQKIQDILTGKFRAEHPTVTTAPSGAWGSDCKTDLTRM